VSHPYFKFKGKRREHSHRTTHEWVARIKADAEIMAIKTRAQEGTLVTNGKITLGDVLAHFLKTQDRRVEADEFKRRTYEAVEDGVKKIRREQPSLPAHEAAKVSFKELDDYVHQIRRDQSPTTVNKVVDALKTAYAIANEEQLIAHEPTKKLKRASIHAVKPDVTHRDPGRSAIVTGRARSRGCSRPGFV
jgi:hypothetical protein